MVLTPRRWIQIYTSIHRFLIADHRPGCSRAVSRFASVGKCGATDGIFRQKMTTLGSRVIRVCHTSAHYMWGIEDTRSAGNTQVPWYKSVPIPALYNWSRWPSSRLQRLISGASALLTKMTPPSSVAGYITKGSRRRSCLVERTTHRQLQEICFSLTISFYGFQVTQLVCSPASWGVNEQVPHSPRSVTW